MIDLEQREVWFNVSGRIRTIPRDLWESLSGPLPPEGYACNGCTKSPDVWLGIPVWIACIPHDWCYDADGPVIERLKGDWHFRKNIWKVARYHGAPRYRAAYVTLLYWRAVVRLGWLAFKKGAA